MAMDEKRYEAGLAVRKAVLTAEHVENTFRNTDAFTQPLQELITEVCWGIGWADEGLERPKRSLLTLGILASLGRFSEFETHVRAALNNGVTKAELQAALIHIAIYCGMPAAVESARSMQKVFNS
ncbi:MULTISPECIES: carboxymuconolactone decarboxylase family protein [unclassified Mesorhizobium]|uniref:carboxymuconolactone decarboxylase family protein n=1 Tax=unclassified Mesorhizobium TaxID=325217 RepID=UPI001FE0AD3F|nr:MULTISPECIES: carboxymuconolactone decarboxylase family protein [unclassified Mesorhizobium]